MDKNLVFGTVRELGELIRTHQLSPVELTEAYLGRLETIGPKLGAVITVTRNLAMEQAKAAEKEINAGRYRGPLHGIPYGVKIDQSEGERWNVAQKKGSGHRLHPCRLFDPRPR